MWLIFEGLDKSGKTTLEWAFLKKTNYKHNIIDRGPVGYLVFDEIFNRSTDEGNKEHIYQANKVSNSKDFFVVYCKADLKIIESRLHEHNENFEYDYIKAQNLLDKKIKELYSEDSVLEIDTSSKSIEECAEEIANWFRGKWNEKCNSCTCE